jgi:tRNA dimethylallyltransferase
MAERPVVAVVGPTASGKSALGVALAERFGGEVVNCDSVQVYREIEIATAKITPAERRGVPHHLIDFVPPSTNFTAGDWARLAATAVGEIEARGRLPLLVGGSGFYLRSLREPLFQSPPTNERLRARLGEVRARCGPEHLHRMLRRLDPPTAELLQPRDWSRVQRALEIRLQTGTPISRLRQQRPAPPAFTDRIRVFALSPPREELYARIDARADAHFGAGLVEEVRALLSRGVPPESTALGSHGYRRVVEHLQGLRTLESAVLQTKLDVRHYAKRQLTWFRRESGVEWFEGFGDDRLVQARVASRLSELGGDALSLSRPSLPYDHSPV